MDAMEERRSKITQLIDSKGQVHFTELKAAFPEVSEMTIRTDLKALDLAKRIVRIHGGAKSVVNILGNDDHISLRSVRNISAKQTIVEKAIKLIEPNMTVFIDSGSTATMLAKAFPDIPSIVYTTSVGCATELASLKNPKVFVPGGQMNHNSLSIYGAECVRGLSRVNFDIAFMGVTSYSPKTGFTCGSAEDAEVKHALLTHAKRYVMLMDSTKVGKIETFTFCRLNQIDALIGDGALSNKVLNDCKNAGVPVY